MEKYTEQLYAFFQGKRKLAQNDVLHSKTEIQQNYVKGFQRVQDVQEVCQRRQRQERWLSKPMMQM